MSAVEELLRLLFIYFLNEESAVELNSSSFQVHALERQSSEFDLRD